MYKAITTHRKWWVKHSQNCIFASTYSILCLHHSAAFSLVTGGRETGRMWGDLTVLLFSTIQVMGWGRLRCMFWRPPQQPCVSHGNTVNLTEYDSLLVVVGTVLSPWNQLKSVLAVCFWRMRPMRIFLRIFRERFISCASPVQCLMEGDIVIP